jgi:phosphohistidine swiveling domain-containing protein/DNA-binding transcriptional ArsR family regulator
MGGLFYSPTTQKILAILCESPEASFHVNELIRLTGKYPNSVTHALKGLEKTGLVTFKREGRKKLYRINTSNPIYPEVKSIFAKLGTFIDEKLVPLEKRAEINWFKLMNRPSDLPLAATIQVANNKILPQITGIGYKYGWYNGVTTGVYQVEQEKEAVNQALKAKIERNPAWAKTVIRKFGKSYQLLEAEAEKTSKGRLYQLSNKELAQRLKKYYSAYLNHLAFISVPSMIESWLSKEIKEEVEKSLSRQKRKSNLNRFVEILTSPPLLIEERLDSLKIVDYIKKNGFNKKTSQMIMNHTNKWAHLSFSDFSGPLLNYDYFKEEIEVLVEKTSDPLEEIKGNRRAERKRLKEIKDIMEELKFSNKSKQKIRFYQDIYRLRNDRWDAVYKSHLLHLPLIDETGRRLDMSRQDLSLLTYEEMINLLVSGKKLNKGLLAKRKKGWAVLLWEGEVQVISGIKEVVETMERFRIVDQIKEPLKPKKGLPADLDESYQLKGTSVYKGEVRGSAKIVLSREDFNKVREGDIVVAHQTTPQYLSCLYRAGGLIIDESNPQSHAVLYAKALKIPTIIGAEFGTKFLKDGDKVFLDANKGIVKKINNPGLGELNSPKEVVYARN